VVAVELEEPPPAADCRPLNNSDRVELMLLAPVPCTLKSEAKVLLANCEDELSFETGDGADDVPWAVPAASPSKSCRRLDASCPTLAVPPVAPDAAVPDALVPFCPISD
jgi:hypothetical protein